MIVLGGVTVWRIVATPDMTANLAEPQMDPTPADLQTVFTSIGARRDRAYLAQMFARLHNRNKSILVFGEGLSN